MCILCEIRELEKQLKQEDFSRLALAISPRHGIAEQKALETYLKYLERDEDPEYYDAVQRMVEDCKKPKSTKTIRLERELQSKIHMLELIGVDVCNTNMKIETLH